LEKKTLNYFHKFLKDKVIIDYEDDKVFNYKNENICVYDDSVLNYKEINSYLFKINNEINNGNYYLGKAELQSHFKKNLKFNNNFFYLIFIFYYRVFPKLPLQRFVPTYIKPKYKILSKAEILGRMVYNGFKIIDYKSLKNNFYFLVKKTDKPIRNISPSYSIIYSMPRLGLNKKIINVHKLRTMHPYSEFLQDFIYNRYGYNKIGKLNNDFRITFYGSFFRKYWIDELPQLINFFKGEMNLVGPRPVSKFYYNNLPNDIKKNRIKYKPGCIPPSICFNLNKEINDIFHAEREYFKFMKKKYPFKNLFLAIIGIYNIILKGSRSS
tara:strand:- start:2390 stop:3364 length:975 start_codon:yes stop_codon:yes gene_type:complete